MECLTVPVSTLVRRCSGRYTSSRLGYRPLTEDGDEMITVVVGKEQKKFLVDPFVLQESPFRVLIEMGMKDNNNNNGNKNITRVLKMEGYPTNKVIFVDVEAILFEHMLWLLYNDCSSFFKLNVKEIIDFYAMDY
ncbi:hypothetical protein RND81_13G014800 [Saponaria officinalis]|uniref:Uncharacterized protein n=1 Tax=Saponaria officinalis TaxID=3572 RepID=A0AAW1GSX4_SAPOF